MVIVFKLLGERAVLQDREQWCTTVVNSADPLITLSHRHFPYLRRHFCRGSITERGEGEGEKRREGIRARHRPSSLFFSINRLDFLSSFRFPHLHGFSSLFMVVPPCVV